MNSGRYSNLQKVTLFVDGQDYILPRETVVNWFDREDMQAPVGYFSIRDKIADIKANPQTAVILGKAMAEMQKKTMEKYGDVAKNAQIPEEMQRQMEQMSLEALDVAHTSFGIRMISVDVKNGFMLNGRTLMLKGGCIHHDNGILGAASFRDSEYRKVRLHKDNGYNALRFAHNPVSSDMLDACDRLGIVVINEAFDTWNMSKNLHDFSNRFTQEWEKELESFIVRDRNHPSVIIWSIGNEIPEQGGLSGGYQTSAELAAFVRKLDDTRFVAGAFDLCGFEKPQLAYRRIIWRKRRWILY